VINSCATGAEHTIDGRAHVARPEDRDVPSVAILLSTRAIPPVTVEDCDCSLSTAH
jgi:hypothetical protein